MAFLAAYGGLIAAGIGAAASMSQAQQASEAAKYNEKVERGNAIAAGEQSNARQEAFRRQIRRNAGSLRGAIAETGTGFGGSNALIQEQSTLEAEMDALNIQYEGEFAARSHNAQAMQFRQQAANAKAQGYMSAGSKLLSAFGSNYAQTGSIWN